MRKSLLKAIFRYPGGKKKIAPIIIDEVVELKPKKFVDAFVGGGSVVIEWLKRDIQSDIIINDLDIYIYSFWKTISNNHKDLIDIIEKWGIPDIQKFNQLRNEPDNSEIIMSFKALFFNRTTFSGIFRSGPIGGYSQKGNYKIDCRYNKDNIIKNINNISSCLSERNVYCFSEDFRNIIRDNDSNDTFLYLDPPYMNQGHQLYNHSLNNKDYEEMASLLKKSKSKWIVSHDNNQDFISLFRGWSNLYNIDDVAYTINSIKDNKKSEILISNFDFLTYKRKVGRPKTTENYYVYKCCKCGKDIKTNPNQINKQSIKYNIIPEKLKNSYICRKCRRNNYE